MNFLQIWIDKPLPAEYKANMLGVLDKMEPGDTYTCISDVPLFLDSRVKWLTAGVIQTHIDRDYDGLMTKVIINNPGISPVWKSDILRMYWLSRHPDTLYLDTDGILTHKPALTKISFGILDMTDGVTKGDYYAIYNLKNCSFFLDCMDRFNKHIAIYPERAANYFFIMINVLLRSQGIDWYQIGKDIFNHGDING